MTDDSLALPEFGQVRLSILLGISAQRPINYTRKAKCIMTTVDGFMAFTMANERKFLTELFGIIMGYRSGIKSWYEAGINCYELALTYKEQHRNLTTVRVWDTVLEWREDSTDMLEIAIGLLDKYLHGKIDETNI